MTGKRFVTKEFDGLKARLGRESKVKSSTAGRR